MANNGNKVEDYIQTRSGAQIRSHAQKYFLKIQKEYPGVDPFEIFKSKTPEVLEEKIFMKKRGESEDMESSASNKVPSHVQPPSPKITEPKPQQEHKEENSDDFSKSVEAMLARKKSKNIAERPALPQHTAPPPQQDVLSVKNFPEYVKLFGRVNNYGKFNAIRLWKV